MNFQQALLSSLGSNGEAQAIDNGGKGILYSELYADVKKVADVLLQDRPGKETVVGVAVNDRTGLIVSMIGVIAARCVFVPIDLSLPEKRLAGMMEELDLQYIITSKAAAFRFEGIKQYFLEDILDREVPNPLVLPEYDGEDSLYVYFTSGSTGTPKGIVGRNSSLLQFIQWEIAAFNVRPGFRVSQLIHPYFDAFLRDVFVPLLAGGTVCIPPADEDILTPGKLIAWIDESRVNLIHCVPSVFRQLNEAQLRAEHFTALQYVLLSGEKIIPAELDSWYRIFGPRIQLVNFYGATETTMIRAWYPIKPEDVKMARVPIGQPIADTELLVLDGDLNACDTLVPGDLYIVSDYVTKGYLNNPALTRERFLKIGVDGEERTAYRTGDRARVLTDGNVDLLGREDRQIKLRGIRIEPEEIENVLLHSGCIKTAVVCTKEEENGDVSLAAFVIRAEGVPEGEDLIGEVKQHLQQYLPEYMIPAAIVEVREYPLLGNGKINYKALGQLLADRPIVAPVDAFEEKLLTIWKEILGDKAISTEDSFHKIGGNSLSIMKLIGRVYKEFNVRIALSDVFNNLTIRKQAQLIRNTNKNLLYVIPRVAAKPAYHVSSAQERMYYNQELNKAATAYNLPMAWHIHGDLDRGRLVEAFRKLIERHEGLRTSFRLIDGELFQEVKDSVEFGIEEIFLSGQDCGSAILAFTRPFDLSQAPLLRCGIISDGKEEVLVVDLHHIICDGLSQMNLLNDLMEFYIGGVLKPLDKQYKDYAEWEYHFKTTDEYIAHREFWLRTFEGELPVLHLPTTGSDGGEVSERGGSTAFSLDHADIRAILDLLKQEGMTPFPGLFALYFLFLSQLTGQEDIVIGVASSGRMQEELEDVAGMFVKTLPIRYRLDFNQSLRNIIKEINKYLILATSRQVYDLTNIVEELNNHNATPIKSLFDVMFVYQNYDEDIRKKGEMAFTRFMLDAERAKYPLTLFIYEHEDYFGCKLEYLSSYFTKEDIDILIAQFRGMAADLSSNIDAEIIEVIGTNESATDTKEEDISFNL